ncbi:MAG: methionine sulfoxide reductase heme-binding subunit [Solirubrobacteraceae bacterium]|nr:methionine sulfoxide reductase heme-binding subunit [Solirubrobacteraceae bacterium]
MIAAAGPSALWYLTRGTGVVTLVLLTSSVVLGVLQQRGWTPLRTSRFMTVALHRAVSLLVIALLAVHVGTAVLDSFAPIRLADAVLPFTSRYRPVWLGLGAVALDLVAALVVTSLLRRRLGLQAWRAIHWLAYACWPVALVHGWGTGSDARTSWMLAVTLGCSAAVLAAAASRLLGGWPHRAALRAGALGAGAAIAAAAAAWLVQGPLARGWTRRSGTPTELLASSAPARAAVPPAAARVRRPPLLRPFSARVRGTIDRGLSAGGLGVVDLRLHLSGASSGALRVRIAGQPAAGGGVIMTRSAVTLGPARRPQQLQGRLRSLTGSSFTALLASANGRAVRLRADLVISGSRVRGQASGRPIAGAIR